MDSNIDINDMNEGEAKEEQVPNSGEGNTMATVGMEVTAANTNMVQSPTAVLPENNVNTNNNGTILNLGKFQLEDPTITVTSPMEVVNNNDSTNNNPLPTTTMIKREDVDTIVEQEQQLHQQQQQEQEQQQSVLVPFTEFAEDVDLRLGRANGNVYHRRPGIPDVNDGQIMVRLKKKRFIVIDYGIVPTINDIASASMNAHVTCPPGAGKQICCNATPDCNKIGVPVLLYDSDPEQPHSLYMRSGLCFTCQRLLNEKRRTQRKRKSDTTTMTALPPQQQLQHSSSPQPMMNGNIPHDAHHPRGNNGNNMGVTSTDIHAFSMDSAAKRFRLNGEVLDLAPDAIIINGPLVGTKHQGHDYGYMDIGNDLLNITKESFEEFQKLVSSVTKNTTTTNMTATTAQAASGNTDASNIQQQQQQLTTPPATALIDNYKILSHYEKTFLSMSKGIFLLSQWKASWDLMIAAAAANAVSPPPMMMEQSHSANNIIKPPPSPPAETAPTNVVTNAVNTNNNNVPPPVMTTLPDSALLASAAAVAAAQSVVTTTMPTETHHHRQTITQPTTDTSSNNNDSNNNMVPLLMAAQSKNDTSVKHETGDSAAAASTTKVFGV